MNQTYMKEKKIFPLVMSMALPMMLSMAFNSLYNIVDSYFVAKLSEDAMTALSLVYPAQNLLTAVAVLRCGCECHDLLLSGSTESGKSG